jgi:hypothetical protein
MSIRKDSRTINLLYVSASLLRWPTLMRAVLVEAGQRVAPSLPGPVATEGVAARGAAHRPQPSAHPIADLRQRHGRRPLRPPVGCPASAPDRAPRPRQVRLPALPGPPLVRVPVPVPLASLAAGGHARAGWEAPRPCPPRWLLQVLLGSPRRGQRGTRPMVGLRGAGIRRRRPRPRARVRAGTPRDHPPCVWPGPFACETWLAPSGAPRARPGAFGAVPPRHPAPPIWGQGVAPGAHRGPGRLQGAAAGGAGPICAHLSI